MDSHSWFKEAVTEAIAVGYHKVVKVPMDLGTILKKVRQRFICLWRNIYN